MSRTSPAEKIHRTVNRPDNIRWAIKLLARAGYIRPAGPTEGLKIMTRYLTDDGTFKSDKYAWCPPGFFALKLTDPIARLAIMDYACHCDDEALATDLMEAVRIASREHQTPGYKRLRAERLGRPPGREE